MIDSDASIAPCSPPLTGASTTPMPRLVPSAAKRAATSGRIVLQSIYSSPGLALAKTPSSPRATLSTSGESGSMVITTSAPATACATLDAPWPPAATSRSIGSGRRL